MTHIIDAPASGNHSFPALPSVSAVRLPKQEPAAAPATQRERDARALRSLGYSDALAAELASSPAGTAILDWRGAGRYAGGWR